VVGVHFAEQLPRVDREPKAVDEPADPREPHVARLVLLAAQGDKGVQGVGVVLLGLPENDFLPAEKLAETVKVNHSLAVLVDYSFFLHIFSGLVGVLSFFFFFFCFVHVSIRSGKKHTYFAHFFF
jgi:hypothetical protein